MYTFHGKVSTHRLPGSRRKQLALAAALCATIALGAGGATAANAAGPDVMAPGGVQLYPTWGWGSSTQVCAQNLGASRGQATVRPASNFVLSDQINVGAYETRCIWRSWWGSPIFVFNTSPVRLKVWTY